MENQSIICDAHGILANPNHCQTTMHMSARIHASNEVVGKVFQVVFCLAGVQPRQTHGIFHAEVPQCNPLRKCLISPHRLCLGILLRIRRVLFLFLLLFLLFLRQQREGELLRSHRLRVKGPARTSQALHGCSGTARCT